MQASCGGQDLSTCLAKAGLLFLESPEYLMIRMGKDVQDGAGRIYRAFEPVQFPEVLDIAGLEGSVTAYRLEAVGVNAAGSHYNCFVRNQWSECWHFCDDAQCQLVEGDFATVAGGEAQTHGLVFLYRRLDREDTGMVRLPTHEVHSRG